MRPPPIRAFMQRRILVNYRVDPDLVTSMLPATFRPVLIAGHAIAGICLIRLGRIRPVGVPAIAGPTTENAAHRIAVQWDTPDGPATGVYIPRRDSDSLLTTMMGGRVFPGWHHRARFAVAERADRFRVEVTGTDGLRVLVDAIRSAAVRPGSVFGDVQSAAQFFGCAPVGYSARPDGRALDGVELHCTGWNLEPLAIQTLTSSFFEDDSRFPPGTATPDSAFLMRDLDTTWSPLPRLRAQA